MTTELDIAECLPDFIVIGAMKSGTSSLHATLNSHSDFDMSSVKETNFFLKGKTNCSTGQLGLEWYSSLFKHNGALRGEASPNYTKLPRSNGTAEHIYSLAPHCKLIYLVRDPIRRSVSHYFHNLVAGRERSPIKSALSPQSNYVALSQYYRQLVPYLRTFSMKNILIMTSERLWNDSNDGLNDIFEFLGVEASKAVGLSLRHANSTGRKLSVLLQSPSQNEMQSRLAHVLKRYESPQKDIVFLAEQMGFEASHRRLLEDIFREDSQHLFRLIGRDLNEWTDSR